MFRREIRRGGVGNFLVDIIKLHCTRGIEESIRETNIESIVQLARSAPSMKIGHEPDP